MKESLIIKIVSGVVWAVVTIAGVVRVAATPAAGIPVAAGSEPYIAGSDPESLAANDVEDEDAVTDETDGDVEAEVDEAEVKKDETDEAEEAVAQTAQSGKTAQTAQTNQTAQTAQPAQSTSQNTQTTQPAQPAPTPEYCGVCNAVFYSESEAIAHVLAAHSAPAPQPDPAPAPAPQPEPTPMYVCACGFKGTRDEVKAHMWAELNAGNGEAHSHFGAA